MSSDSPIPEFPWYAASAWSDLQQGDLLIHCPVLVPSDQLTEVLIGIEDDLEDQNPVAVHQFNLIIMSQSCDLARDNLDQVLLCAYSDAPLDNTGLMGELKKDPARSTPIGGLRNRAS